ncbi:YceD family protein [Streptococcus pneumoniae]
MKFNIQEIKKNPEGLAFDQLLDLAEGLKARNEEILDVKEIRSNGKVQYEDALYFLDYDLSYTIVLASSRSMEPVEKKEAYAVHEVFMEVDGTSSKQDLIEEELVLPIEGDSIDLSESVADNILLNIPLKVLTQEEETSADMPSGQDWQVLSEEDYERQKEERKAENSPFAGLQQLFDED